MSGAQLPGVLGDIADVAGEAAALKVAAARGGTRVYIPPEPPADHWLVRLIGMDAARAVCARLTCGQAGLRLDVPQGTGRGAGRRRADAARMMEEGKSEREIALATGYTGRGLRKLRARMNLAPADDRQHKLF